MRSHNPYVYPDRRERHTMTESETAEIEDAKEYMRQIGDTTRLLLSAENDRLSDEPRTEVFAFDGDTRAEALGHAYHIRDAVRESGHECEAELLGPTDFEWNDDMEFYEVAIHINGGDEASSSP